MAELKYKSLKELLKGICDAIRNKTGGTELINHQDIPDVINSFGFGYPGVRLTEHPDYPGYAKKAEVFGFRDSYPKGLFSRLQNTGMGFTSLNNAYLETVDLSQNDCGDIPDGMFYMCNNLKNIIVPKNGFRKIEHYAFNKCSSLEELSTSEVTYIGSQAFAYCSNLNNFDFSSVEYIGGRAFYQCNLKHEISLPRIKSFENSDNFHYCQFTKVTVGSVGNQISEIGSYIFDGCNNLSVINIYISDDKTSLSDAPFGCTNTDLTINYYSATTGELISTVTPNAT